MNHKQKITKKLIKQLQNAFVFEEKIVMEFQHRCYGELPGNLNEKELDYVRKILELIMIQSLGHAGIVGDLIIKLYENTAKSL
jgi:hypothetical protein